MAKNNNSKPVYRRPAVIKVYRDKDFITEELPFVGATSNYKTFVPLRREIQV